MLPNVKYSAAIAPDWVENNSAAMVAKIKRSPFAAACFSDVRHFMADGFAADVAMAMAWNYWGA